MTSRVTPFLFDGDIIVRVVDENGRSAWVTADVCHALGLKQAADAVRGLDDDEKGMATIHTLGGSQKMSVVYESGLYGLIFKSRKEEAIRFRKWITSEVLPALRQTGSYATSGPIIVRKPYAEWSLEEWRVKLATVNTAYKAFNKATAAWTWEQEGLPMPPAHLLPGWFQATLIG